MKNYHRNNLSILTHSCWILWRGKIWTANFPIFTAWLYTKSSSWALNTGWKVQHPDDSTPAAFNCAVQNCWESSVGLSFCQQTSCWMIQSLSRSGVLLHDTFHLFFSFLFLHFWDCYTRMSPTLLHCKLGACAFTVFLELPPAIYTVCPFASVFGNSIARQVISKHSRISLSMCSVMQKLHSQLHRTTLFWENFT